MEQSSTRDSIETRTDETGYSSTDEVAGQEDVIMDSRQCPPAGR